MGNLALCPRRASKLDVSTGVPRRCWVERLHTDSNAGLHTELHAHGIIVPTRMCLGRHAVGGRRSSCFRASATANPQATAQVLRVLYVLLIVVRIAGAAKPPDLAANGNAEVPRISLPGPTWHWARTLYYYYPPPLRSKRHTVTLTDKRRSRSLLPT